MNMTDCPSYVAASPGPSYSTFYIEQTYPVLGSPPNLALLRSSLRGQDRMPRQTKLHRQGHGP